MSQFDHEPPLTPDPPRLFLQVVESREGQTPVAMATWQSLPHLPGVYQLLWVEAARDRRRRGKGSEVLNEAIRQCAAHGRARGAPLRRLMALLRQEEVVTRAWLIRNGFLHVHTLVDLDKDGDTLVMVRTFD